ncbi:unnamed protein product [Lupinus luteus]|uniref:Endoglucanase n=1 Tax=Lupinus luteus TaxID=3873 RepID=A0AAV1XZR2_LUPLU
MSMYDRDPWSGTLEINTANNETQQSWLLSHGPSKKKRYVNLGCIMVSRNLFLWTVSTITTAAVIAGIITLILKIPPRHHNPPPPDNYTIGLHNALMFFNAQRSGELPKSNNVSWRGNSCLQDGKPENLVGGYYDAGDAVKYNFPQSFAITMLSWSVIEYSGKYEAVGELDHVKDIIKWGTDYLLKTFNSSADTIGSIAAQVGTRDTSRKNDHICWIRPEDIDYPRPVTKCSSCSDLAAEMAAALAAASIVFNDDRVYSKNLVHAATTLFKFSRDHIGQYDSGSEDARFYNSSGYFDEFVWGGAWMYYATGNSTYLNFVTTPSVAQDAGNLVRGPNYGVLSWDNKLAGAQVLLSRLRLFLSPGYPYEDLLRAYQQETNIIMCSYLPFFQSFDRTKGGLIKLNHGRPQPLHYVVNAAFLATLYSDYLDATHTPGWYCGPNFFKTDVLRDFAKKQINYILGNNPQNMSYIVGFGKQYPKHVHHRGASISKNNVKYKCKEGLQWRDTPKPNPNTIIGAMVAGPDKNDGFQDVRSNYNYTEPTLAGNAGLVAALVALSGVENIGIDKNTIFSAVPPMYPKSPPSPSPWKPKP